MKWLNFGKKQENDTEFQQKWKKDMLDRWIDLEARVTGLELIDKEYKKRIRRTLPEIENDTKDLKGSMLIPE